MEFYRRVVAYPSVDFHILKSDAKHKKNSECPCEYNREMFLDDVVPEMFLHEMIRREDENQKHEDAEAGEKDIHPLLVQEIDAAAMSDIFCRIAFRN